MIDPMATGTVTRPPADLRAPRGREAPSTHPPAPVDDTPNGSLEQRAKNIWASLYPWLRRAVSHRPPPIRIQAYQPLDALRRLCNSIAHHGPIFARPLLEDHERILEVAGWISPGARTWIERRSRVRLLLAATDDEAGVHF